MRFLISILFFVFISHSTFSQLSERLNTQKSPHNIRTVIKGNPFTILAGVIPFSAEYRIVGEYVVAKNQASQVGISYLGKSPIYSMIEASAPPAQLPLKWRMSGYHIQVWHKFYITQFGDTYSSSKYLAPSGFYFGPKVAFASMKMTNKYFNHYDVYLKATHLNVNLMFGGQALLGNFAIDIFTGIGYKKNEWIEHHSPTQIYNVTPTLDFPVGYSSNIKLSLGFNIGYGF